MGANVEALKTLYVALGGDADEVAGVYEISEMIEEIAEVVSDVILPSVGTDDNGKVLKVANGKWGVGTDAT